MLHEYRVFEITQITHFPGLGHFGVPQMSPFEAYKETPFWGLGTAPPEIGVARWGACTAP